MEHEGDTDTNCALWTIPKGFVKALEELENIQVDTVLSKALFSLADLNSGHIGLDSSSDIQFPQFPFQAFHDR